MDSTPALTPAESLYWDEISKLALTVCLKHVTKRMSKGCTQLAAEVANDMLAERRKHQSQD